MNIEFIRSNNEQGYVSNEYGEINKVNYTGNIEEILNTENKIEILNNEIIEKEEELKEVGTKKRAKINLLLTIIYTLLIETLPLYLVKLMYKLLEVETIYTPNGKFGITTVEEGLIFTVSTFIQFFAIPILFKGIYDFKKSNKERKILTEQISYLKDKLTKNKNKLEELKCQKEINKKNIITSEKIKLKPKEELEKIKNILCLIEDYIKKQNKYTRLFEKNALDFYLEQNQEYTEEEIELINNLIIKDSIIRTRKLN